MQDWIKKLNEAQRNAVTAPLGHALVLAGAGSGKTSVLVYRIAWLVHEHRMPLENIMAVTFTNKAANEMKSRLGDLLGYSLQGVWIGTFHSMCHRFLRRHYQEAQLPAQFHILDSDDQARVLKQVIVALNLDLEVWPVKKAQNFINNNKDEGLRPQHMNPIKIGPERTLLAIYQAYEKACSQAGVIDFAELLLRTYETLKNNPTLLTHYQQRFQAILIDEFQDTNTIQYAWLRLLAGEKAIVMAVGDDDQSIYSWRGAQVGNIQSFSKDFKAAKVIRLEQNYRSTSTILEAANALIHHNYDRMGKDLWTAGAAGEKIVLYSALNELDEARFVCERIELALKQGMNLSDIAILYRSNAQSRVLEEALLRSGFAYRIYGGVRFFERAEVKDTLAYLRLIANPHDDTAFERVINFPTRGIGDKTLEEIHALAKNQDFSLWQAATQIIATEYLPHRATAALTKFMTLIQHLTTETAFLTLDKQVEAVIKESGLREHFLREKGEKAISRLENMQELVNAAKQFCAEAKAKAEEEDLPILVAFLAHTSLETNEMQVINEKHYAHLMTLHAAKGLEFPQVFIVGMEEGLFPSHQSISEAGRLEEERRLFYVGMTRAMQRLILSYAEIRRQYGREAYHRPSRFLQELPRNLIEEVGVRGQYKAVTTKVSGFDLANESGFRLGENVFHPKFGQGIILAVEGSGEHTRVQIRFANHDTKWLVVAYANLTSVL